MTMRVNTSTSCPSRYYSESRGVVTCNMPLERHKDEGSATKHLSSTGGTPPHPVYWKTYQQQKARPTNG